MIPYGRLTFEHVEETDWKKYSEKIRAMLEEHLDVTGLKMVCKLRWGTGYRPQSMRVLVARSDLPEPE